MTQIRNMLEGDAAAVARLHAAGLRDGFLHRLGGRFLATLYRGMAEAVGTHVWVAESDGDVCGFCAYTRNVRAMYADVLRARFVRLAFASLPHSLNPFVLKEVLDTYRYPAKQQTQDLPAAEILSIAVAPSAGRTGVGRKLLEEALHQAANDGVAEIKVVAGAQLEAANRFYTACGFERRGQIVQHGHALNVYVRAVTKEAG